MVLGLSSSLTYTSAADWAKKHSDIGCRAINFPLTCESDKGLIDEFKSEADKNGLFIAEVGVWRNTLAADPAERKAAIEYSINQLKLADYLDANCCVNIAGTPHGPRWDGGYAGNYSKETWDLSVKTIQHIIDEAAPTKTKFTIEPMPWMLPSSPDAYLELIKDVNRPAFGVHLDVANMINCPERYFFPEKFMEECFSKLGDLICSCHLKDVLLLEDYTFQIKECACGVGTLPIEKYAELANSVNKNMPMIIEHLNTDEEYYESLRYVQNRLKDYITN